MANVTVASVAVGPQSATLVKGQTQQLAVTLKDANGNVLTGITVTWASSSPSAATVSTIGLDTGIAPGSTRITATAQGKTSTALITVTKPPVASVTVSQPLLVLNEGQTRPLVATLKDATGNELTGRTVTWSSSNPSVATVSTTGLVTGKTQGSATITATAEGISGAATIEIVLY